ncbi:MAG: (Fe-S)-binding protein, partial [Ignavibacteria bacterium]
MTLRTGFFLVILLFSFSFFFFNTLRLIRYLRIGKPETRAGRPLERLKQVLTLAFGHSKLFREPLAGLMHFFIFWGFVVLVFAIVETIGEGLRPGFTLSLLGPLYGPLAFLEDVLGLLVILSAVVALLRRYVTKPPRLDVSGHSRLDATIILLLILLIMCAMFGQNAANIERGLQAAAERRFVSRGLAPLFNGCSAEALDGWFSFFWWTHISIVLGFLNYLPYSKHLHILSSIPNVYLAKLDPRGVLKPLNLQDEKATKFGAADVEDLTWKQLLDGYTCTECGRCTAACPAALTGKPLSPKKIVVDIRRRLMEKAPLLSG